MSSANNDTPFKRTYKMVLICCDSSAILSVRRVRWVRYVANGNFGVGVVTKIRMLVVVVTTHRNSSSSSSSNWRSSTVVTSSSESQVEGEEIQQLEQSQDDDEGFHHFQSLGAVATSVNLLACKSHGKKNQQPRNQGGRGSRGQGMTAEQSHVVNSS